MIKVTVYYQNGNPGGLLVEGHSGKNAYGHDLVCAAVSAVITGGFNDFQDSEINEVILKEGYAKIIVKQSSVAVVKLNMIITQLKTISDAEPDYLVFM